MESLSLNEVQATVTKACLGAGADPGSADEIGAAVRWLCCADAAHFDVVLRLLQRDGSYCGQLTAAIDFAVATGRYSTNCETPEVLIGLAGVASRTGARVRVSGPDWGVTAHRGDLVDRGGEVVPGPVIIESDHDHGGAPNPEQAATVSPSDEWTAICAVAARTYVPSSEHSRTAGAGAGLTDND